MTQARRAFLFVFLLLTPSAARPCLADDAPGLANRIRRPLGLCLNADGTRLFVANGRSGTLSVIDTASARLLHEVKVGKGLADVTRLPDGRLLAVDQAGDALVLLQVDGDRPRVAARLAVSHDPVQVLVSGQGADVVVSSRDSRRLTFVTAGSNGSLQIRRTLDLPFRPRNLAWLNGPRRLVVADAFGGQLAVVEPESGRIESVRNIPGHNIRGLAATPDGRSLVVAHQVLERTSPTTLNDVHFGALMRNALLVLSVDALLRPGDDDDLLDAIRVGDLDGFGNGAGDPSALSLDSGGGVVVGLAGVGEVALSASPTGQLRRVGAGIRPSAVAVAPGDRVAYSADAADDAVWAIQLPSGRRRQKISLGPRPEPDAVERGERLFHNARLAHDHWLSCQSCHTDGQTNGLLADTLGDGSFGAPKMVISLLGVGETGPWAWDGTVDRLEVQVRKSVEATMQGTPPTEAQVADLTAYLRSLRPLPGRSADPGEAVERGRAAFLARKCDACHAPPTYTTPKSYDVGLTDEVGNTKFNPPSLRGVGARAPLFHDGSAEGLEDVLMRFRHPKGAPMTSAEAADLIAFLRSL